MHWRSVFVLSLTVASTAAAPTSRPAAASTYADAVATWIGLHAAPGYEQAAMEAIRRSSPGWTADKSGNLIKRVGGGSPRRVVACGLDAQAYVVGAITPDGYLRVHGSGTAPRVQLWDQFHEGQRVVVAATDRTDPRNVREVPGVFAVQSNHLWRRRAASTAVTTIEDLWVDVGARNAAEVARMGIKVLDPVFRDWPAWTYGDYVAGPAASSRAGCAAVAAAADAGRPRTGETIFVISAQSAFGYIGLGAAVLSVGPVDSVVTVEGPGAVYLQSGPRSGPLRVSRSNNIARGAASTRFAGTLTESVRETDLTALFALVASRAIGSDAPPTPVSIRPPLLSPMIATDSLSRYAQLLGELTSIYAVAGHEAPMRDAVRAKLPAWARGIATVDTAGNLIVAFGPDHDTTLIVAHLDEIGFEITRIAPDGMVSLRTRGTFYPYLWEGQTALLHRDGGTPSRAGTSCVNTAPLRGVFVARDSVRDAAREKNPTELRAWFGMDSAALVGAGACRGQSLTSAKMPVRAGAMRFLARSIDDRAGSSALLLALGEIDSAAVDHKVIFAWSVREEGGLEGAQALAAEYGASLKRVHAVDTFVSSDSPVESDRFAGATLGDGAALRALDNSSVTPPAELGRALRIARAQGIPLQAGVTNGGNDGSEIAKYGAPNVAVAWPLRYSHSPAEVMDLRDLRSLSRIVAALAKAPARR